MHKIQSKNNNLQPNLIKKSLAKFKIFQKKNSDTKSEFHLELIFSINSMRHIRFNLMSIKSFLFNLERKIFTLFFLECIGSFPTKKSFYKFVFGDVYK
jgi:hypothetical protein